MTAKCNTDTSRLYGLAWVALALVVLSVFMACSWGDESLGSTGSVGTPVKVQKRDWKKFTYECISRVEQSDAVFYRRGERVTGKELARQMREYLKVVLRVKSVPDPFGRNAGILLAIITTHEGIAMDGLTDSPQPCEVEVGGRRMKVYDWLKQQLGVDNLPGEEEGHEVLETLYDAEITPELLARWERYIEDCIQVVRGAKGITFSLRGEV